MEIKDAIKKLREVKGWTQSELAVELGTTKSSVSAWESGDYFPKRKTESRIYELLGNKINIKNNQTMDELIGAFKIAMDFANRNNLELWEMNKDFRNRLLGTSSKANLG